MRCRAVRRAFCIALCRALCRADAARRGAVWCVVRWCSGCARTMQIAFFAILADSPCFPIMPGPTSSDGFGRPNSNPLAAADGESNRSHHVAPRAFLRKVALKIAARAGAPCASANRHDNRHDH